MHRIVDKLFHLSRLPQFNGWLQALLIPAFAVQIALTTPIEEHAFDAAAFHVWRSVVFSEARAEGSLYPRWVMPINGGLGGPLFSFYSPLAYYLMDTLQFLGFQHPIAWRILIALGLIAGSLGMYALGLRLFRRIDVALVSAACFTYAPYLLRDFFERGAPQGIAIALYPLMILLLLRLVDQPSGLRLLLAALCWSAIILIHNLSAALLLPILAIFGPFVALRHGPRVLIFPTLALIMGLMLASFHVVPFIADSKYVQLNAASQDATVQPARNPLLLSELMAGPAIFDTGLDNNSSGFSVGILQLPCVVAAIPLIIVLWRKLRKADVILIGGLSLWAGFTFWMQLSSATPIWESQPGLNILQFRVRLLSAFGLIAAILIGYVLQQLPSYKSQVSAILIAVVIFVQLPSLYPTLLHRYGEFPAKPTVKDARTWAAKNRVPGLTLTTSKELTPIWRELPYFSDEEVKRIAASPIEQLPAGTTIISHDRRSNWLRFQIDTSNAFTADVHLLYFPGWAATINGQTAEIIPAQGTGYTQIDVPAGTSTIEMRYTGTSAQHWGDLISLLSAVALIAVAIFWQRAKSLTVENRLEGKLPFIAIPVILFLLAIKGFWIDPSTTLLRATSTCEAPPGTVLQVNFSRTVRLCSYSVDSVTFHPGDTLRLTTYWQMDNPQSDVYYSFVHVIGEKFNPETNNPIWGQQDKQNPGTLPTSLWIGGRLYRDIYEFQIPAHTPPGTYQLEIGWTDSGGQRLVPEISNAPNGVTQSDLDALILSKITIR